MNASCWVSKLTGATLDITAVPNSGKLTVDTVYSAGFNS